MSDEQRESAMRALGMVIEGVRDWKDLDHDSFMLGLYMGMHAIREAPDLASELTSLLESTGFKALGYATPETMEITYRDVISHIMEAARG